MIPEKKQSKIPAGLMDPNFEFFIYDGQIMILSNGKVRSFDKLQVDDSVLLRIREDMDRHPDAIAALIDMGITDPIEQMKKYVTCRYGNFDDKADLTRDGVSITEYWNCGKRGFCKYEGTLCARIPATNGVFTSRELQVINMISKDLPNKLIADGLFISIMTVSTHIQNIQKKIGCHSKAGVVAFAAENNLI